MTQGAPGGSVTLTGNVRTSAGKPVAGADVCLAQSDGTSPAETKTSADGDFTVQARAAGTYRLTVTKSGFRTWVSALELRADDKNRVALTLEDLPPTGNSTANVHPSPSDLEFTDQPNFSVAGMTDASAAGGHGSTATMPLSESLARETVRLKSGDAGTPIEKGVAESELRTAVQRAPQSFSAQHELGEFYLHSGKPQAAIPPLEMAYRLDPHHYANAYDLVLAYQRAGDLLQAKRQLAALMAMENRADLHRVLGEIDEQLKQPLAAVQAYEQAVRLDPSEANYFAWGSELLLHRAIQPAIEVLSRGANAFPASARMLAGLGAALYAGGSVETATECLCQASDLAPGDEAPHLFLGKIMQTLAQPLPCAEEKLGRFRDQQPGNAWAQYYYALALAKRAQRMDEPALAQKINSLLEKAISIDPHLAEALVELGSLEAERGNLKQAIVHYERAIDAKPALAEAHYRLARAYKQMGETEKARQELDSYRQIEKREAAESERERRELREFVVVLKQPASEPSSDPEHQ
jgi:tetratricopeptide (TPR) repeat protein